jgi:CheY-specific phosphatase CheX
MTLASDRPDLRRIGESSFKEVLKTLFALPAALPASSNHGPLSCASDQITSSVLLAGPRLSGSVHIQLPRAFIIRVAQVLTGLDGAAGEINALLDDTAGELVNMVAGRVAVGLAANGYACTLGIPSVSHGAPLPVEFESTVDHGRTDLVCDGHRLSLEVDCRFASS